MTWTSNQSECVRPIKASVSLRSCRTATLLTLLCETERFSLCQSQTLWLFWQSKMNFQVLFVSVFFSIRGLIEVSLWVAPLPIYFPIIPADKYFDVSVLLRQHLSVTKSQTEVCVPIGVQVIHPACPYLWCNSTLIHSVANAFALTKLHDQIRTATTFPVSVANTHKQFPCGLKCQWSGKCWMKPMFSANHILAYVLRHTQTHSYRHKKHIHRVVQKTSARGGVVPEPCPPH